MKQRTLVISVGLSIGLLALLVVLLSQGRHSTTAVPSSWPPLLLTPCTPTTVHIDQQLFADDGLPAVAQALAEAWRVQGWSTQLDVREDGSTALLTGQRAGQHFKAFFEQGAHSVHLVASGEQQCDPSTRAVSVEQPQRGALSRRGETSRAGSVSQKTAVEEK